LRFDRMSGLGEEQLDELEDRVAELLEKPWNKGTGRPKELTFRETLVVACGYMRQNIIEEVWAEVFDVDQSMISRIITFLTPLVERATEEFRLGEEEAAEAVRDVIALVDGTLWPCWSWDGHQELWAGKIQDDGTRLADHHESCWPGYLRVRARDGEQARHGEAQGIDMRDDPKGGRRRLRG
jgi:hypothetical protein